MEHSRIALDYVYYMDAIYVKDGSDFDELIVMKWKPFSWVDESNKWFLWGTVNSNNCIMKT